jgi:hypothetical protein
VIDLRRLVLLAALAAACDKPSDLPRKHDEVLATARIYQDRFDDLRRRAEELDQRLRALPAGTANVAATQHTLALARTTIEMSRGRLGQLPTMLESWTQSGDTRKVQELFDGLRLLLDDNALEATSELSGVESWTALAEHQPPGQAAAQPPPVPEPDPMPMPGPPEPAPEDRAPDEGSAAPVRPR